MYAEFRQIFPAGKNYLSPKKKKKKNTNKAIKPRQRAKAESARNHHLFVDVSNKEKKLIQSYCDANNISVSEFLAGIALQDAAEPEPTKGKPAPTRTIQIELTEHEYAKVVYKARLREESKEWGSLDLESLRCYVSDKEHKTLLKHLKRHGHSSRHYIAFLALRKIEEAADPVKKK